MDTMSKHSLAISLVVFAAALLIVLNCGGEDSSQALAQTPSDTAELDSVPVNSPLIAPAMERVEQLFPDAQQFREWSEPFPYLAIYDPDEALLGYQVNSDLAQTTAEGYIGPVPVRVFLDTTAALLGIDILENKEDSPYLQIALGSDLIARLLEYQPGRTDTIDAVTLATSTSTAIIQSVTSTIERVATEVVSP